MGALWLLALAARAGTPQALPVVSLAVGDAIATVEVADDPHERGIGLMFRDHLEPDHGMVFVDPDEDRRHFWMKDTAVPLSIAFLSKEGVIVWLADLEPYDTHPVGSVFPAAYALEMPRGWFAEHGVAVGDRVEGLPPPSKQ